MSRSDAFAGIPVVILCGGAGILVDAPHGPRLNKALVPVHGQALVTWVMRAYAQHGATEFLLAIGWQAERFDAALRAAGAHPFDGERDRYRIELAGVSATVRCITTPVAATTGARLLACRPALEALGAPAGFALTYSDTLSDVDLGALMRFHRAQGRIATLVAANLPVRFRILGIRAGEVLVRGFASRPVIEGARINGGFYCFTPALWSRVDALSEAMPLEERPLEQLAAMGELAAFDHPGAWQSCDAERDLVELERLARGIAQES